MSWYATSHEMLLYTYPLHDVWDLCEGLLRHLLLRGKQRSLVNVGLG